MGALKAVSLTSMLVEVRGDQRRGVRRILSSTPKLRLIRCRNDDAEVKGKVAAAVAMATGANRDMTAKLQEHVGIDDLDRVYCDVLPDSRSCRARLYGSKNPVPAGRAALEKRSSKAGVGSKKPLRLGSTSWDLLD